MIAFLHTTPKLKDRFEELVVQFNSDLRVSHYVNEELLQYATKTGETDDEGFKHEVEKIKIDESDVIICTCSTYGEASDRIPGVKRIDRPVAEYLVSKYHVIGLVYTAKSTFKKSLELLLKIAKERKREIQVENIDCTASWDYMLQGDQDAYYQGIKSNIIQASGKVDAIFLAQASMEPVKEMLADLKVPVYSSPEIGIKTILSEMEAE